MPSTAISVCIKFPYCPNYLVKGPRYLTVAYELIKLLRRIQYLCHRVGLYRLLSSLRFYALILSKGTVLCFKYVHRHVERFCSEFIRVFRVGPHRGTSCMCVCCVTKQILVTTYYVLFRINPCQEKIYRLS